MIRIVKESKKQCKVSFYEGELHSYFDNQLRIGMGTFPLTKIRVKEIMAAVVKELKKHKLQEAQIDVSPILGAGTIESMRDITEGLILGGYELPRYPARKEAPLGLDLTGVLQEDLQEGQELLQETIPILRGVLFARDMVNLPGNKLRPLDFAENIEKLMEGLPVEVEVMKRETLHGLGMNGLLAVGESSDYEPCFLVMKYLPLGREEEKIGLVGKGVTCDTGGYCLKSRDSMLGIKGDMAGGAAVAGAVYALAKNQVKKNVLGFIPMCENRISPGSLLPGDVYTTFDKTTVEVVDTDAEGRLILADAVSYAVNVEKVGKILDIATLTGAVVNLLGFTIAGAICDNDSLYGEFEKAYGISGEQYLRIPFLREHEKMLESRVADIKNRGENYCGTITAGLFIRRFAKKTPWIHLDIAGTAWVDTPVFEFQSPGATGAAVTTLYYLCNQKG
ncbi:MAG TPA: hypothetical protein GXX75_15770 [Clostridiales bacterium]|nr:hypothetical protein [Clostridiales bacterium]